MTGERGGWGGRETASAELKGGEQQTQTRGSRGSAVYHRSKTKVTLKKMKTNIKKKDVTIK